jgi:alpha-glucosidase
MKNDWLWWRDGIIYQIYPRSFADSNGDGIGDLPGITARLDYLADLGVDAIWLSPIYPSPDADFGYDVSDYYGIDPRFGTLEDFDALLQAAHERGIHVVLDLVLNHTSDQHPMFIQSRTSRDNPYHDWYFWRDPLPGGAPPNNWASVFGGGGWEYDPHLKQYYFHMFVKQQPDLNWRNPAVRQAVLNVMRYWLDKGVDGFRLDVFNAYFKDAQLQNNPRKVGIRPFDMQKHIHDIDQPEMLPLLSEMRSLLDGYPERYFVGETFLSGAEKAASYTGPDRLHAAFNFDFLNNRWSARGFQHTIQQWETLLGPDRYPNYVLNNHDTPRSATRYTWTEDDQRLKLLAAMLLTLRGTPFMYYGEEIGMRDISLRRNQILDPVGKRYYPFHKGRDGCRAPMQWTDEPNAGFSSAAPWLPIHPDYTRRNVSAQTTDDASLLNFYKNVIAFRRNHPALHRGTYLPLTGIPFQTMAYLRQYEKDSVLVALNFSDRPADLNFGSALWKNWKLLISSIAGENQIEAGKLHLRPLEACLFQEVKK